MNIENNDGWLKYRIGFLIFGVSTAIIVIFLSIYRPDLFEKPKTNNNIK
jgi:hypothetical protein